MRQTPLGSLYLARLLPYVVLLSLWLGPARAQEPGRARGPAGVFQPSAALTLSDLERAVELGLPELEAARRSVAVAAADVRQSRLLPNPTLDADWSTIPVGQTNPRDLDRPYANVPSYGVGVGYTFPLKKRESRRRRAEAMARGAEAELEADTRGAALELAEVLGALATATLRQQGMTDLVEAGKHSVELVQARVKATFGAPLDADRMTVEVQRTEQALAGVTGEISEALSTCSSLVGTVCLGFADPSDARGYLNHYIELTPPQAPQLSERADLRALSAYSEAMRSEVKLADAEAIPDPTVRLGYVHDRFLYSGNQRNSLNVGVSIPLPLFDRGQARRDAALASQAHLASERDKRLSVAQTRVPALIERLAFERSRCTRVGQELIPHAQSVLDSLQSAAEKQLLPLTDVIQARRAVVELYIDQADSCGDAFRAALSLLRETSMRGAVP